MSDNTNMAGIMRRIEKLLAMANDGRGDANEAASAAAMAEKLMRKFNIEHADLQMKDIARGAATFAKRACSANMKRDDPRRPLLQKNPPWGQWLAYEVAKLNDCELRQGMDQRGAVLIFMGFDSDTQVAAWMFDYLVGELIKGCRAFNKAAPRTKIESNSFRMGFVGVLQDKLRKTLAEKTAEMQQAVASRALVVSKAQAIAEHFGAFVYKESNSNAKVSGDAFYEGIAAGNKVDVTRRGLGTTQQPTPKEQWVKVGELVTIDGTMIGRAERIVETDPLPYVVVQWPTSVGRHSITTLRRVDKCAALAA